jgi:L-ascorbate metabolism protein UlaG (beta-lactamase superfamily)
MPVLPRGGISATPIGGPTALLEIGGLRLLTDPTFDQPGEYPVGQRSLVKTQPPAWSAEQVGRVDAVLLSHDQHPDNLDAAGRQFLATAPLVLTTGSAAERLGGTAVALTAWEHTDLARPDGGELRVTAVPAGTALPAPSI